MICIPLVASGQVEALQRIGQIAPYADIIELRMDLLGHGSLEELMAAVRSASADLKILVTNRVSGTALKGDEKQRLAVLLEAVSKGADFVDVELETSEAGREEIRAAIAEHDRRTALIISHHDFSKTPSFRTLRGCFRAAVNAGADVVKIVTLARFPEDNLRVLRLISSARREKTKIIAFCMGKEGKISRLAALPLGSLFVFAAAERGAESAPGQLTVQEMKQILKILEED